MPAFGFVFLAPWLLGPLLGHAGTPASPPPVPAPATPRVQPPAPIVRALSASPRRLIPDRDGPPPFDLFEWMVPTYPGAGTTHLRQQPGWGDNLSEFSSCPFPGGFFRVSSPCGRQHEKFVYDERNIFIVRETFQDRERHFRTHENFVWLRRFMNPGDGFRVDCAWTTYEGSCTEARTVPCSDVVWLEGPTLVALGGDLGALHCLVRKQRLGDRSVEAYYYARPYGFVKFEHNTDDGLLVRRSVYNRIEPGELRPHPSDCFELECPGQDSDCPERAPPPRLREPPRESEP